MTGIMTCALKTKLTAIFNKEIHLIGIIYTKK